MSAGLLFLFRCLAADGAQEIYRQVMVTRGRTVFISGLAIFFSWQGTGAPVSHVGMNQNSFHVLMYLNTWSPVGENT